MQISKINNQNFGANPCHITKLLLVDLMRQGKETQNIMRMMKGIYHDQSIRTAYRSNGEIIMDMFSKHGVKTHSIIKTEDNLHLDPYNFTLKEPEKFKRKLYDMMSLFERTRSADQKFEDIVFSVFPN